jgi:hypothetical protein
MDNLIYEDKPRSSWFLFYLIPLLIIAIIGINIKYGFLKELSIMFVAVIIIVVLNWGLQPRSYYVLDDRIKIIRNFGFSAGITFKKIDTIREIDEEKADIYSLMWTSYTTSTTNLVEIIVKRKFAPKVYLSPGNRKLFLENLNRAVSDWRRNTAMVGS